MYACYVYIYIYIYIYVYIYTYTYIYAIQSCTTLHCTTLCDTIRCYTMLYGTITIPVLHNTIPYNNSKPPESIPNLVQALAKPRKLLQLSKNSMTVKRTSENRATSGNRARVKTERERERERERENRLVFR